MTRSRWPLRPALAEGHRAVSGDLYYAAMPTLLSIDDHLAALVRSGAALGEAAAAAGLDAKVPTCPGWDVTGSVVHQHGAPVGGGEPARRARP